MICDTLHSSLASPRSLYLFVSDQLASVLKVITYFQTRLP